MSKQADRCAFDELLPFRESDGQRSAMSILRRRRAHYSSQVESQSAEFISKHFHPRHIHPLGVLTKAQAPVSHVFYQGVMNGKRDGIHML